VTRLQGLGVEPAAGAGSSRSAWADRSIAGELVIVEALAAVSDWEAEHGALTQLELAAADEELDGLATIASRLIREGS
jgi:hypothetical protein